MSISVLPLLHLFRTPHSSLPLRTSREPHNTRKRSTQNFLVIFFSFSRLSSLCGAWLVFYRVKDSAIPHRRACGVLHAAIYAAAVVYQSRSNLRAPFFSLMLHKKYICVDLVARSSSNTVVVASVARNVAAGNRTQTGVAVHRLTSYCRGHPATRLNIDYPYL